MLVYETSKALETYTFDTNNHILEFTQGLQKQTCSRKLTEEDLQPVFKMLAKRPYGQVILGTCNIVNDIHERSERTRLVISWWSWRREKKVNLYGFIGKKEPLYLFYSDGYRPPDFEIHKNRNKEEIWRLFDSSRYWLYKRIKAQRYMSSGKYAIPPNIKDVLILDQGYNMILLSARLSGFEDDGYQNFLCSPLGYIMVRYENKVQTAAKSIGIKLPNNAENCTWEDIEPQWIMAQLQKL